VFNLFQDESRRARRACVRSFNRSAIGFVALNAVVICCGCGAKQIEGFAVRRVAGDVKYLDGTNLPACEFRLCFALRDAVNANQIKMNLGCITVGGSNGEFKGLLRLSDQFKEGEQIVVSIGSPAGGAMPATVVPAACADLRTTPLQIILGEERVELRLPKP
jgi:hypothetical protein